MIAYVLTQPFNKYYILTKTVYTNSIYKPFVLGRWALVVISLFCILQECYEKEKLG